MNYTFQFGDVFAAWPLLLQGTWVTIQLSFSAMAIGLALAILCAWGKTSGPAPLRFAINTYIELIRNTPFLVQLFFFFFALPAIGLRWSPQTAALTAMVVNLGAYATERSSGPASNRFPRARSRPAWRSTSSAGRSSVSSSSNPRSRPSTPRCAASSSC